MVAVATHNKVVISNVHPKGGMHRAKAAMAHPLSKVAIVSVHKAGMPHAKAVMGLHRRVADMPHVHRVAVTGSVRRKVVATAAVVRRAVAMVVAGLVVLGAAVVVLVDLAVVAPVDSAVVADRVVPRVLVDRVSYW